MKTMSVREFLRGEYRTVNEPVLVMSYRTPIGIWQPVAERSEAVDSFVNSTTTFSNVEWKPDTER